MPIPPFAVPEGISQDGIRKLFEVFKPIKIGAKGRAFRIKPGADLFTQAFLWDAKLEDDPIKEDLYLLKKTFTVHSYGAPSLFKPSINEVLQQAPMNYSKLPRVYFEVAGPEEAEDMNLWIEHIQKGVHVATTSFYIPLKNDQRGLDVILNYFNDHPEMLSREDRQTPTQSAVMWLEALDPDERAYALRHFCRVCGVRLNNVLIDSLKEPPFDNYCDTHAPDPGD